MRLPMMPWLAFSQVIVRADFEGNPVRQVGMATHLQPAFSTLQDILIGLLEFCPGYRWSGQHHLQGHSCRCTS
jgi:hypothetical protein